MVTTIYHNPRCRKSRETLQILQNSCKDLKIIDYQKNPLTASELREISYKLGIPPQKLIRKSEAVYKENYKGKDLSDEEWLQAMAENPKLMERPVVVKGEKAVIGRPPENVNELL